MLQDLAVSSCTAMLQVLFETLDLALLYTGKIWSSLLPGADDARQSLLEDSRPTVVIVGGNFSGLAALWYLIRNNFSSRRRLKIVLIEQREYFEYTPGILRLLCEPQKFFQLAQRLPHDASTHQVLQGKVLSILEDNPSNSASPKKILTYQPIPNPAIPSKMISYDYLILATGANFSAPISPAVSDKENNTLPDGNGQAFTRGFMMKGRHQTWQEEHQRLEDAKSIIILGGGAVGVELAAEIVDQYPVRNIKSQKHVILVDCHDKIVHNFPPAVSRYATKWLKDRGVQLKLGQRLKSWNTKSCTLQDGTVLRADLVYECLGGQPNSDVVSTSKSNAGSSCCFQKTPRGHFIVDSTLQVLPSKDESQQNPPSWYGSIFACGDVASPPLGDEKQAFQAEMQGKLAARNVLRLASNPKSKDKSNLYHYPFDVAQSSRMPLVFVLSLGKADGILGFNNVLTIPGPLAAVVKWILECTKIWDMQGRPFGKLIWKIGDPVALFLSRTILKNR